MVCYFCLLRRVLQWLTAQQPLIYGLQLLSEAVVVVMWVSLLAQCGNNETHTTTTAALAPQPKVTPHAMRA
jgi:hypothetical protein